MPTYDGFIINSDFATMGETGNEVTGTITLSGGTTVTSGNTWTSSIDLITPPGESFRCLISSSKIADESYATPRFSVNRAWSGPGSGGIITEVLVYRLNSTTIRVEASAFNPYGSSTSSPAGDEVFTIVVSNLEAPY